MTTMQRIIKYLAIAFAVFLIVSIITGICRALSFVPHIFDENTPSEMTIEQAIDGNFSGISINISAAELDIQTGEKFTFETNHEHVKCEEMGNVLKISERGSWFPPRGIKVILTIPKGTAFDYADISAGAGSITIDSLSAKSLSLDLGAGELIAGTLNATDTAEINGGAGSVTINTGHLNNADIDMGVGEFNFTGEFDGESSVDYGVGETNLILMGTDNDYKIELDKGIGEAMLDGKKMSDDSVYGGGSRHIEIDGGVGDLNITFKKKEQM